MQTLKYGELIELIKDNPGNTSKMVLMISIIYHELDCAFNEEVAEEIHRMWLNSTVVEEYDFHLSANQLERLGIHWRMRPGSYPDELWGPSVDLAMDLGLMDSDGKSKDVSDYIETSYYEVVDEEDNVFMLPKEEKPEEKEVEVPHWEIPVEVLRAA